MKRSILLFTAALLAALTTTAAALQHQQQTLSQKMVRLHVVANSDTEEDQALKLKVRDAVLSVTEGVSTKEELQSRLPKIKEAAQECLERNGSSYVVSVTLKKENFPTRIYDTFSLPAGAYTALRVRIGAGEGQNWWCVAFPSICLRAASDWEEAATAAGFTDTELNLMTEEHEGYSIKFKALELLQSLKEKLFCEKEIVRPQV